LLSKHRSARNDLQLELLRWRLECRQRQRWRRPGGADTFTVTSISGTANGSTILGLSSYDGPDQLVFSPSPPDIALDSAADAERDPERVERDIGGDGEEDELVGTVIAAQPQNGRPVWPCPKST